MAACFHPAFKLRWLADSLDKERKRIQNLCINSMEANFSICETSTSMSETGEEFFIFASPKVDKQQSQKELELITFLNDTSKTLQSLNNYPTVKILFIRFNTSLCSSAVVKRLFSFAGYIQSPSRGCLSDECFRRLIFLKGNHDIYE